MTTVVDGGLATTLESHGHDLTGSLWSAKLLLCKPSAVRQVHAEFFEAGAEIAVTASYQASGKSLTNAGYDCQLATEVIRRSVQVAREAREQTGSTSLVAGSVGAYGASLADGSEYTGEYHLEKGTAGQVLRDFHRPRMAALLEAGADLLACETLPSAIEVAAMARLIAEFDAPAWVSLTPAPGGRTTRDGVPLAEAVAPLAGIGSLVAVGVNCCAPGDVLPALRTIATAGLEVATIAYPNSGEEWDARARRWTGRSRWREELVRAWAQIDYLGGCCRVGPEQIAALVGQLRRDTASV